MSDRRQRKINLALAVKALQIKEERERQSCSGGLIHFVRYFWRVIEPGRVLVEGWPLEALCIHLEAVAHGEIRRLLINVPPGFMKSLLCNVFLPAYIWGPLNKPDMRFITASYSQSLTLRDNVRFRNIITSPEYIEMYGDRFAPSKDQFNLVKVANDKTGWKLATSVGGVSTGERSDFFFIDDGNSVKEAESEAVTATTNQWFREVVPTRLNDAATGTILNIQQRTNENDISGVILREDLGYEHLCIPLEYDCTRHCTTSIGWTDPRSIDGELAWPGRFPENVVRDLKCIMGPYAVAGQFQQMPTPRGGGLIKSEWWQPHEVRRTDRPGILQYVPEIPNPPLYVLASLDTAFSEKESSDFSALTVWVVYNDPITKHRRILLADAWQKRLPELSGETVDREPGESEISWRKRQQPKWGLAEWVAYSCKRRRVNKLIVENKNRAPDAVRAIRRLMADQDFSVQAVNIHGDKWARASAVVDLFTDGMIHAPAVITQNDDVQFLDWASSAINEIALYPKGSHDDLLDSMSLGLQYLRDNGWAIRKDEARADTEARSRHQSQRSALYPA